MTYTIDEMKVIVAAAHPADEHWTCADCCDAARTRTKLAAAVPELIARCEELEKNGPLWMQHAITILHESVDLTDPEDPVGVALTRAGLERNPEAFDDGRDGLLAERDALRARCEELEESERQSARYHKRVCVAIEHDRDVLRAQVEQLTRKRDEMERMLEAEQDRTAEQHGATMQPFRDVLLKEQAAQLDQLKSALREACDGASAARLAELRRLAE